MKVCINEINIYRNEIECLIKEFPRNVIFFLFINSLIFFPLFQENHETVKSICEGIISGFIFYIIIEVFPSAHRKIIKLKRFGEETAQVDRYFEQIMINLKEELRQIGHVVPSTDQFFILLQNLNISYVPQSTGFRMVHSTTVAPSGLQFNYSNLGHVLDSHLYHIRKKIVYYNKIADIHGINDLDTEIAEVVRNLEEKTLDPAKTIAQLGHIRNSAAFYGSELDLLRSDLKKIQKILLDKWFTKTQ